MKFIEEISIYQELITLSIMIANKKSQYKEALSQVRKNEKLVIKFMVLKAIISKSHKNMKRNF